MFKSFLFGAASLLTIAFAVDPTDLQPPSVEAEEVYHRIPLAEGKPSGMDKYEHLIDRTKNYVPPRGFAAQLKEYLWGKDQQTVAFE